MKTPNNNAISVNGSNSSALTLFLAEKKLLKERYIKRKVNKNM